MKHTHPLEDWSNSPMGVELATSVAVGAAGTLRQANAAQAADVSRYSAIEDSAMRWR